MEDLSTNDVATAVFLLALGITMVITSFWLFFRNWHQLLPSLGHFFHVGFALVAGLLGLLAASFVVTERFELAALYIAIAVVLYLLGLGLRRLMTGY